MGIFVLFSALLIAILLWDYNFSWYAGFLRRLEDSEPDFYSTHCSSSLPPSLLVHHLMGSGKYIEISSASLKKELREASDKEARKSVALVVGWVILILIVVFF